MSRPVDSRDLLAGASLWATVAIFFWKLLFTNLILARGDTFFYIYPYWSAAAEALRAGRFPLWNPDLFMGAPFFANSQVGLLYPLNWPLWLLVDTPTAGSLSILFHLWLAAGLAYGFARSALQLRRPAAWLAAVLFALGGYLTAQVEHINQLQGMAWLPAVFWLLSGPGRPARALLLGGVLALQLLAGHTQAAFITVVGAAVYAAWLSWPHLRTKQLARAPLTWLVLAGLLALVLSAGQLLPTLELSQHSVRGGGGLPLTEAVSFSLPPLLLGRALLPGYGETIFSEYVAFVPLSAIGLALIGLWAGRGRRLVVALALIGAVGLFFSLGAANPAYHLLVRYLPGFGLFRAPARWLVLYAFGAAGLAGLGVDALLARRPWPRRPVILAWLGVVVWLAGWALLAPLLTGQLPAPPEAPVDPPSVATLVGWLVELALAGGALWLARPARCLPPAALALASLFLASRALPYNHPTAPEAYHALRPAAAHLQAAVNYDHILPPGRFLSISDIFFDPGDTAELESIYGDQLDEAALYDLIIASKQKEILAPNLPLALGVPAVDGYDGGVLPLAHYVTLQPLLLPAEAVSIDGRLRENLDRVPDGRWLNLFNVRYLITDKVGDAWADGVFYDLQHAAVLDADHPAAEVAYLPPFEATGLGLVLGLNEILTGVELAQIRVAFSDGTAQALPVTLPRDAAPLRIEGDGLSLYVARLDWDSPSTPVALAAARPANSTLPAVHFRGLSLVDERDGSFQSSGPVGQRPVPSGPLGGRQDLREPGGDAACVPGRPGELGRGRSGRAGPDAGSRF